MAKRKKLEEKLADLARFAEAPSDHREEITAHLQDKSNVVVAKAVDIVADADFQHLREELAALFDTFMKDPLKRDPGCHVKLAVVKALTLFSHWDGEIFLAAVRHKQMEPSWGPPIDTAVNLRIEAALALVRINYSDVLFEIADLLMDLEPTVRAGAAEVLETLGGESAELILRLKLLGGETEADVLAQCMSSLMHIAPERSLSFIGAFLDDPDPFLAESAALAIGDSRAEAAFALLRRACEARVRGEERQMLLLPIALTRLPEAVDFLLERLDSEGMDLAKMIVEALRIYSGDEALGARIGAAVTRRGNRELTACYEAIFAKR